MALYGAMSLWRMPFYFEMRSPVPGWWKSLEVGEKIWSLYTKKCRSIPYFSCTKSMSLFSPYVYLDMSSWRIKLFFRPIRWRIRFQLPRKPTGQGFLDQQNNLMRQDDMASQISRPARSLPARYDMAAPIAQLVACRTRCERRIYAQSESWAELEANRSEGDRRVRSPEWTAIYLALERLTCASDLERPCHSIVWHAKDPSGRPETKLSVELGGLERLGVVGSGSMWQVRKYFT